MGWPLDLSLWLVIVFVERKKGGLLGILAWLSPPLPPTEVASLSILLHQLKASLKSKPSLECSENKTFRCTEANLPTSCPWLGGLCLVWKEPW